MPNRPARAGPVARNGAEESDPDEAGKSYERGRNALWLSSLIALSNWVTRMNAGSHHRAARMRFACALTAAAVCAVYGRAQSTSLAEYRHRIAESEQRLEKIRASHDERAEATELIQLGELLAHADEAPKALETENKALEICIRLKLGTHAGVATQDLGWIYMLLENKKKAEAYLKIGLEMEKAAHNANSYANTLNNLGDLAIGSGLPNEAFDYYDQALKVAKDSFNRFQEAATVGRIGNAQMRVGQFKQSLETLNRALSQYRDLKLPEQQAGIWLRIASVHSRMGEVSKAIEDAKIAIDLRHTVKDRAGQALATVRLGGYVLATGDEPGASRHFAAALKIFGEVADSEREADALRLIGQAYAMKGLFARALDYYNRALEKARAAGYNQGASSALGGIAYIYTLLGEEDKSLDYWAQQLQIADELGHNSLVANITSNMSTAYANTGRFVKGIEFANKALSIWLEIGNPYGEAHTLHTLGWIYENAGQHQKALDYFERALPNHQMTHNTESLYYTLRGMGEAEEAIGHHAKALVNDMAALSAAEESRSPSYIGQVDTTLMRYWRNQKDPELAVLFGVKAVNNWQNIRGSIRELDERDQEGFLRSKSAVYRELAELLVELDRLDEAEQVLDLLKEQELEEVVRGDLQAGAALHPVRLSPAQEKADSELSASEARARSLVGVNLELTALRLKQNRTPEEQKQVEILNARMEAETGAVSRFFADTLYPELIRGMKPGEANVLLADEKAHVSELQNVLAKLGPDVAGIRILMGEEHCYALFVTANGRTKYDLAVSAEKLRGKILEAREVLKAPLSDPRPQLAALYSMLVAPMESELLVLEKVPALTNHQTLAKAPTILWSLDGALRYLPIAALFDGRRYMVERFDNVLFTPESYGYMSLDQTPSPALHALAMGLSKAYRNLPPLPGAMEELLAVVHDPAIPASHGPLDGKLLSDDRFTYAELEGRLDGTSAVPIVHIASHFVMENQGGTEPFLLLAGEKEGEPDGYRLTLSKLEDSTITFRGTRLLTLSACSTGRPDALQNGMEVESLGMIAQKKEAQAVLATLWDVNDVVTSRVMSDFYSRWLSNISLGKGEALRDAQLELLRSKPTPQPARTNDRGFAYGLGADSAGKYAHPYYWAPFVLTGSFQ